MIFIATLVLCNTLNIPSNGAIYVGAFILDCIGMALTTQLIEQWLAK